MLNLNINTFQITTVSNTPVDKYICSLDADGDRVLFVIHGGGADVALPATNNYVIGGDAPVTPGGVALIHRASGVVAVLQESVPITSSGGSVTIAVNISGDNIRLRLTGPSAVTYRHCVSVTATKFI